AGSGRRGWRGAARGGGAGLAGGRWCGCSSTQGGQAKRRLQPLAARARRYCCRASARSMPRCMRCRMVGRVSVPKTAAAVANSGADTRVVAVAAKWRAWAMRAARTLRTAAMRPGMGRVGAGVVGAVPVMGMVVAGFGEQSKNFVMEFLIRGYVGGAMEADRDA